MKLSASPEPHRPYLPVAVPNGIKVQCFQHAKPCSLARGAVSRASSRRTLDGLQWTTSETQPMKTTSAQKLVSAALVAAVAIAGFALPSYVAAQSTLDRDVCE